MPAADLARVADVVPVVADWPARYLDDSCWDPALGLPRGLLAPSCSTAAGGDRPPSPRSHCTPRRAAWRFYADLVPTHGPVAADVGRGLGDHDRGEELWQLLETESR